MQIFRSENDLKALQSVGQIVGEVLRQLTEVKFIVKATNGPRYVVGCRRQLDKAKLRPGTRVALDMTTLTIMRHLPREVDPLVYNMYVVINSKSSRISKPNSLFQVSRRSRRCYLFGSRWSIGTDSRTSRSYRTSFAQS